MKIKVVYVDKNRGRVKAWVDGTFYNIPKGLYEKILKLKKEKEATK